MRSFRYPNAVPPLGSTMVGSDGQPTEAWRRYFEAVTTQLGGQGGDQLDDLRTLAEASHAREIDELRALIEQIRGQVDDTAGQLEQVKQDAERQAAVLMQEVSTAVAMRTLGPLAEKSSVDTADVTANAITSADSTATEAASSGYPTELSFTQVELARHTQTLATGSTAILDCQFTKTEVAGGSIFYVSSAGLSPPFSTNRDVIIRLLRDPDGVADVLKSIYFANGWNGNTSPYGTFEDLANSAFIYEDSGHSGGETTWAIDMVSYSTGTTTPNSVKTAFSNVTRSIYCLEVKR